MAYAIYMGIPEMASLWNDLQQKHRNHTAGKTEEVLYQKWGKALKLVSENPRHPGLHSHDIPPLSERYGKKVWESYLENRNSDAFRMFWVYGPGRMQITVIGLDPHPEDKKNGAYDRISLSELPM